MQGKGFVLTHLWQPPSEWSALGDEGFTPETPNGVVLRGLQQGQLKQRSSWEGPQGEDGMGRDGGVGEVAEGGAAASRRMPPKTSSALSAAAAAAAGLQVILATASSGDMLLHSGSRSFQAVGKSSLGSSSSRYGAGGGVCSGEVVNPDLSGQPLGPIPTLLQCAAIVRDGFHMSCTASSAAGHGGLARPRAKIDATAAAKAPRVHFEPGLSSTSNTRLTPVDLTRTSNSHGGSASGSVSLARLGVAVQRSSASMSASRPRVQFAEPEEEPAHAAAAASMRRSEHQRSCLQRRHSFGPTSASKGVDDLVFADGVDVDGDGGGVQAGGSRGGRRLQKNHSARSLTHSSSINLGGLARQKSSKRSGCGTGKLRPAPSMGAQTDAGARVLRPLFAPSLPVWAQRAAAVVPTPATTTSTTTTAGGDSGSSVADTNGAEAAVPDLHRRSYGLYLQQTMTLQQELRQMHHQLGGAPPGPPSLTALTTVARTSMPGVGPGSGLSTAQLSAVAVEALAPSGSFSGPSTAAQASAAGLKKARVTGKPRKTASSLSSFALLASLAATGQHSSGKSRAGVQAQQVQPQQEQEEDDDIDSSVSGLAMRN